MQRLLIGPLAALVLWAGPLHASDVDLCDFNRRSGACVANFNYSPSDSEYVIPADGVCRIVSIQVDGIVMPHRMKDRDVVQGITVFDKSKPVNVFAAGCTSHPTKTQVIASCDPAAYAAAAACERGDRADRVDCFRRSVDDFNSCVGSRAATMDFNPDGTFRIWTNDNY